MMVIVKKISLYKVKVNLCRDFSIFLRLKKYIGKQLSLLVYKKLDHYDESFFFKQICIYYHVFPQYFHKTSSRKGLGSEDTC